jgi:DNA-binding transcriptional ArsR family regulator
MSEEAAARLRKSLASKKTKATFTSIRTLCGPMRFKIAVALYEQGKGGATVGTLSRYLGASPSRISHQLKILKKHRFVSSRKQGREIVYALLDHKVTKMLGF